MASKTSSDLAKFEGILIEKIAKDELGIETLETQNMDSLDFHDVSVACIKTALENAYASGKKGINSWPK